MPQFQGYYEGRTTPLSRAFDFSVPLLTSNRGLRALTLAYFGSLGVRVPHQSSFPPMRVLQGVVLRGDGDNFTFLRHVVDPYNQDERFLPWLVGALALGTPTVANAGTDTYH